MSKGQWLGGYVYVCFEEGRLVLQREWKSRDCDIVLTEDIFHAVCDFARANGFKVRGKFKEARASDEMG